MHSPSNMLEICKIGIVLVPRFLFLDGPSWFCYPCSPNLTGLFHISFCCFLSLMFFVWAFSLDKAHFLLFKPAPLFLFSAFGPALLLSPLWHLQSNISAFCIICIPYWKSRWIQVSANSNIMLFLLLLLYRFFPFLFICDTNTEWKCRINLYCLFIKLFLERGWE